MPPQLLAARSLFYPAAWSAIVSFYRDVAPTFRVHVDPSCHEYDSPGASWRDPAAGLLSIAPPPAPGGPPRTSYCGVSDHEFNWCEKFSSEALIPAMLGASVYAYRPEERNFTSPTAVLPVIWTLIRRSPDLNGGRDGCVGAIRSKYAATAVAPLAAPFAVPPGRIFWTQPHDFGPCAIYSLDYNNRALAEHPLLQSYGVRSQGPVTLTSCFTPGKDVVIPTGTWHVPPLPGSAAQELERVLALPPVPRTLLASMVGGGTGAREMALAALRGQPGVESLSSLPRNETLALVLRSRFCVQADGVAPWSPRLVWHIAARCVPVILSDALLPPFHGLLNWSAFSVIAPLGDARSLPARLAEADYDSLYANLLLVRPLFRYDLPRGGDGDGVIDSTADAAAAAARTGTTTGVLSLLVVEMWRSLAARGLGGG